MTTPTTETKYPRPELTKDEMKAAQEDAKQLFRKYGLRNVGNMILALCLENMRLVKEVQEHRKARGIEPLPTFKV